HSTYSQLYWQMDLRNLFGFLTLRCDEHAQQEIREMANIVSGIVKELFPISFQAWYDYSFSASTLTRLDKELLHYINQTYLYGPYLTTLELAREKYISFGDTKHEEIGMSKREFNEFWDKLTVREEQNFNLDWNNLYQFSGEDEA